jgi:DNA-directed RNA polymerase
VINKGNTKGIGSIISIHDCFGTHPNKMENLSKLVRSEFVLLYTQHNFLEKYNENVINSIKDNNYEIIEKDSKKYVSYYPIKIRKNGSEYISKKVKMTLIPSVPKMGDLELKKIINAIYLIN